MQQHESLLHWGYPFFHYLQLANVQRQLWKVKADLLFYPRPTEYELEKAW